VLDEMEMQLWMDGDRTCGQLRVEPWLCVPGGGLRIGALAILVDMVVGHTPEGTINPTIDIAVRWIAAAPAAGSVVRAEAAVLRSGRQQVIGEASVMDDATGALLGWASAAFVNRRMGPPLGTERSLWGKPGELPASVEAALGTTHSTPGRVDLAFEGRVRNSGDAVSTVMGGVQAVVAELAAEQAIPGPHEVVTLSIRYLSRVKVGPLRAVAEPLAGSGPLRTVRVALTDAGDGDRLVSHVIADVRPLSRQRT
jgi:acyl-coenzyme A thioesterase PaaI-like protein